MKKDFRAPREDCEGLGAPNLRRPRPDGFVEVKETPETGTGKHGWKAMEAIAERPFRGGGGLGPAAGITGPVPVLS